MHPIHGAGLKRNYGCFAVAIVITGLDPVIHLFRKTLVKSDGCADQVRA
jgi:hypothetical protein